MCCAHLLTAALALATVTTASPLDVIASHKAARAEVARRFAYTPELLCATPAVHGLLNKTAGQFACDETTEESFALYEREGVPVSARLMAFISEEHRFIYIRQPKCSSSAILKRIAKDFCNTDDYQKCDPLKLRPSRWVRIADDLWRDYFVFTFVRNPLTRLASAYSFFHKLFFRTKLRDNGVGPPCTTPFAEFTRDSYALNRACSERRCCVYFDWTHKWSYVFTNNYFLREHFSDMSHFVFSASGEPMVDFLGRTEYVNGDWAELIGLLSRRNGRTYSVADVEVVNRHFSQLGSPKTAKPVGWGMGKVTRWNMYKASKRSVRSSDTPCVATYYSSLFNETLARNVAMQYARDFVQFAIL